MVAVLGAAAVTEGGRAVLLALALPLLAVGLLAWDVVRRRRDRVLALAAAGAGLAGVGAALAAGSVESAAKVERGVLVLAGLAALGAVGALLRAMLAATDTEAAAHDADDAPTTQREGPGATEGPAPAQDARPRWRRWLGLG